MTGGALLLAFSFTACSDPGIVYRPAERLPEPGVSGGGAVVMDTVSATAAMEGGGVLCGTCTLCLSLALPVLFELREMYQG